MLKRSNQTDHYCIAATISMAFSVAHAEEEQVLVFQREKKSKNKNKKTSDAKSQKPLLILQLYAVDNSGNRLTTSSCGNRSSTSQKYKFTDTRQYAQKQHLQCQEQHLGRRRRQKKARKKTIQRQTQALCGTAKDETPVIL